MTASAAQLSTWARACRCLEASERTTASVSLAFASICRVILAPSQVASRVSRIVPVTSSTISRPRPRAHTLTSVSAREVSNITLYHGPAPYPLVPRIRGTLIPGLSPSSYNVCARLRIRCSRPRRHLPIPARPGGSMTGQNRQHAELAGLDDRELLAIVGSRPRGHPQRIAACELLVARYRGLVWSCVKPYRRSSEPTEDLMQVGYAGLIAAIN